MAHRAYIPAMPISAPDISSPNSPALSTAEILNAQSRSAFLLLCDHASNALPPGYGTLGLARAEFARHIAYDIGAAGVTRQLAHALSCTAVLARYSRLLVDLNRGADDPTIVMKLSDGAIIPANRDIDPYRDSAAFSRRLDAFYRPYHDAIAGQLARIAAQGQVPVIVSVHSFTPAWRGKTRPWHAGILWDRDARLPEALFRAFAEEGGLTVGDNLPYIGYLKGDTLYRHGTLNGYAHALIEIRQDLIADTGGQSAWAARLARFLAPLAACAQMQTVRHFGSRTDG